MGNQSNDEGRSERLRGHDWFKIRERVLKRDDHTCQDCNVSTNLVVHHIVPIKSTGTNHLTNLVALCRECHRHAHDERIRESSKQQTADASRYLLTIDELRQLLQIATHPLERAIILTLSKTGIGVGELCNLEISDLQLPGTPLKSSLNETPDGVSLLRIRYGGELPYNNRRERKDTTYVPVDSELAGTLKRWLAIRPDPYDDDALFLSTRKQWGKRVSP